MEILQLDIYVPALTCHHFKPAIWPAAREAASKEYEAAARMGGLERGVRSWPRPSTWIANVSSQLGLSNLRWPPAQDSSLYTYISKVLVGSLSAFP